MRKGHAAQMVRPVPPCSTLEELHQETRRLYESIAEEAQRARIAARELKYPKKAGPRRP